MTTFAADRSGRRLAELDARRRGAWRVYREGLRDLAAKAYDDVEPGLWDQLQQTLVELERAGADVAQPRREHF